MSFPLPRNTQRVAHRKSRCGCESCKYDVTHLRDGERLTNLTFRERHIKCDEVRPRCSACSKSNRKCDYAPQPHQPRARRRRNLAGAFQHTILIPSLSAVPVQLSMSDREIQAFGDFVQLTLPIMNQAFVTHTWTDVLLHTQYEQPFLRQCCIAIGAVHAALEKDSGADPIALSSCRREYLLALSMTRKAIARDSCSRVSMMLACALLTMYSSIQSDALDLKVHLVLGMNLLQDEPQSNREEAAWGVLRSIGYLFLASDHTISNHGSLQHLLATYSLTPSFSTPADLVSARAALHRILPSVTAFKETVQAGGLELCLDRIAAQSHIQNSLAAWRSSAMSLARSSLTSPSDLPGYALLIALSLHASLKLRRVVMACDCELAHCTNDFVELLEWLAVFADTYQWPSKSLSWNTGLLPMLFFVASKCADAALRDNALALLRSMPRKEAFWDASIMLHTPGTDLYSRPCKKCDISTLPPIEESILD